MSRNPHLPQSQQIDSRVDPARSIRCRARNSVRVLLTASLAVLLTSCGDEVVQPQNALDPEGKYSRLVDRLWDPVFAIAVGVFILVQGLVLFVVLRFRRRSDDEAPKQVHGNAAMEIGWTIVPALILAVVAVFTVGTIFEIDKRPAGADVTRVKVIGHQWWWEFRYPGTSVVTANVMVIPEDTEIDVEMTSVDVIHSFWVPKLAGKLDVVPTRATHLPMKADHPGEYFGQCAEFCGLSHANMRLRVEVKTKADYKQWLLDQANTSGPVTSDDAIEGRELFVSRGCAGCHTVNGVSKGDLGPNLTHLKSRNTFAGGMFDMNNENLRRWLRNPPEEKPGSKMPNLGLTEDEISKLMAYLETLE